MRVYDRLGSNLKFLQNHITTDDSSQFGERMFELVSQIKNTASLSHVEVGTAMYHLILWINGAKGQCLHISWSDDFYRLSFDGFKDDGHKATQQEVLSVIEHYLDTMQR